MFDYTKITAPYGFVPLAEKVVFPEWLVQRDEQGRLQAPPVHDVPFADGICGTLQLELTAESPIFTRGSKDKKTFFEVAEGVYAIPGTALRGALRNVVEIASFGRLDRVNNHRYAVRDMQNRTLYGQYMAEIIKDPKTGKGEPTPLVSAGWLERTTDQEGKHSYHIRVCDFGKIEYQELIDIGRQRGVQRFEPGRKQSSVDKYRAWGSASRKVTVHFAARRLQQHPGCFFPSTYGVALTRPTNPNLPKREGTLVFTGQPANWRPDTTGKRFGAGNAKHHDFVFFSQEKSEPIPVPREVYEDFLFAHSDRGQQNRLGSSKSFNEELAYLYNDKNGGFEPIPVFFLLHERQRTISGMGLAMMFRLSYKLSIKEAIKNASQDHHGDERLDLASGLFGVVTDSRLQDKSRDDKNRQGSLALKGRVGISHAVAEGAPKPGDVVAAILGTPKASYYPNYVEQSSQSPGAQPQGEYKTWMDTNARPRGWKRYHPMTQTWKQVPPTGADGRTVDASKVGTEFRPLPAGTRFVAHVDVHNLRPLELGALLWALDFGGSTGARHTLGMARPLGYGKIKMSIKGSDLYQVADDGPVDLDACRKAYVEYMESQVAGWHSTPQLIELTALAQPVQPQEHKYQRLDPGNRINEFIEAKKKRLALPPTGKHAAPTTGATSNMGAKMTATGSKPGGGAPGGSQGGNRPGGNAGAFRPQPPPPRFKAPASGGGGSKDKFGPATDTGKKAWSGLPRGTEIEVELTELNRKGKWRCALVAYAAEGTLGGTPPTDAAAKARVKVYVVSGADPKNLELSWSKP